MTRSMISPDPQHSLIIDPSGIAGTDSVDFGVVNDTCAGKVLAQGETCTVSSLFHP